MYNKNSRIFKITYTTGYGNNSITYRYKLGQYLASIQSTIYDIVEENDKDKGYYISILVYNKSTNSILTFKEISKFEEITMNIDKLIGDE